MDNELLTDEEIYVLQNRIADRCEGWTSGAILAEGISEGSKAQLTKCQEHEAEALKAQAEEIFGELKIACPHVYKVMPNRPKSACVHCMMEIEGKYGGSK